MLIMTSRVNHELTARHKSYGNILTKLINKCKTNYHTFFNKMKNNACGSA